MTSSSESTVAQQGDALADALAAVDALTAERDIALAQVEAVCEERDKARRELKELRSELRRVIASMRRYPCPARTPRNQSPCRWRFGHDGAHQTVGGWRWRLEQAEPRGAGHAGS